MIDFLEKLLFVSILSVTLFVAFIVFCVITFVKQSTSNE